VEMLVVLLEGAIAVAGGWSPIRWEIHVRAASSWMSGPTFSCRNVAF